MNDFSMIILMFVMGLLIGWIMTISFIKDMREIKYVVVDKSQLVFAETVDK